MTSSYFLLEDPIVCVCVFILSGATMKQKFLVINCDSNDLEDLRRRMGYDRELVACSSMDEAARLMPSHESGVLVSVSTNGTDSLMNRPFATHEANNNVSHDMQTDGSRYIDDLLNKILEQTNGHNKTLAARVDLLEQKIIEHSLNRNGQHRKETAAELGISRVTLYNKMKKFGLLD